MIKYIKYEINGNVTWLFTLCAHLTIYCKRRGDCLVGIMIIQVACNIRFMRLYALFWYRKTLIYSNTKSNLF